MKTLPTESPIFSRRALLAGVLLITLLSIALSACSEFQYYKQAVSGQISILYHRQPVEKVIHAPETKPHVKRQLQLIQAIRHFAKTELALPAEEAYSSYTDVGRRYVVWNLFASKPLSFESKHWCYLIIGCQSYRGYFDLAMAKKAQQQLQAQGWETWLGGVSAYSTLGWFEDPVLNTFLDRDDSSLAALIFHELSHHIVYVKGDTTFNESFATAVEQFAVEQWLSERHLQTEIRSYMLKYQAQQLFVQSVSNTINQLKSVYQSTMTDPAKLEAKQHILKALLARALEHVEQYPYLKPYLPWFRSPINNAKLMTIASYHQKVPEFSAMLSSFINASNNTNTSMALFFEAVKRLAEMPTEQRNQKLKRYLLNQKNKDVNPAP